MSATDPIESASHLAKALAEEIRIRLLMSLKGGPLGLQHMVEIFEMAPSTLSKHLHVLEQAGLVVSIRQGRWRLYQWTAAAPGNPAGELLDWLDRSVADAPRLAADNARRAVAVQHNPVEPPAGDRIRVLFLCTGNSCRSQMAEALLRARGGDRFEVASAGVVPRAIPPLTVKVMREAGIDIADQQPKSVMEFIGKTHFDYLITVCAMAEEHTPVFPGVTRRLHWPVDDPAAAQGTTARQIKVFRRVRDTLDARIADWVTSLTGTPSHSTR